MPHSIPIPFHYTEGAVHSKKPLPPLAETPRSPRVSRMGTPKSGTRRQGGPGAGVAPGARPRDWRKRSQVKGDVQDNGNHEVSCANNMCGRREHNRTYAL